MTKCGNCLGIEHASLLHGGKSGAADSGLLQSGAQHLLQTPISILKTSPVYE